MIIDDALPGIKAFFQATSLKPRAVAMLIRFVAERMHRCALIRSARHGVDAHSPIPTLTGGDTFFLVYLALGMRLALGITPEGLRRRARVEDVGIPLIVALALVAIVLSLSAIFLHDECVERDASEERARLQQFRIVLR